MTEANLREHQKPLALRALALLHYQSVKPTFKLGLTLSLRDKRLAFARAHQHWTLEGWKEVIWTDETSVIIGHRHGGNFLWKQPWKVVEKTVI